MSGLDPTKEDDDFKITRFWRENGKPMFEFSHSIDGAGNSFTPRIKTKGKAKLADGWGGVPYGGNPSFASSRSRLCCRKRSKGCALSPTRQHLLPCEDEIIENTVDFYSDGYHRILQNAVVTFVKIVIDKAQLKFI